MKNQAKIFSLLFVCFFSFWITSGARGQVVQKTPATYDLQTPRAAVQTHLNFLRNDNYFPAVSAKALNAGHLNKKQRQELAIMLKQIYDGQGKYIDPDDIPNQANYRDSTRNNANIYIIDPETPEIYLEKIGNRWQYSRETVETIEEFHNDVFPIGTMQLWDLSGYFPYSDTRFLGLYLWQYVASILLLFIVLVLHKLLSFLFRKILGKFILKLGEEHFAITLVKPLAGMVSLLILSVFFMEIFPVLQFSVEFSRYAVMLFEAFIPLMITIILYRFIDVLYHFTVKFSTIKGNLDDNALPLLRKLLKVVVVMFGLFVVLQELTFDIRGLLAGISIGGLAVALAAQDTIKNMFGSLMIFVDKPFKIGDYIQTSEIIGDVEEVGFRSTRIRTFHNSLTSIPNGKIADLTIDNMGMRQYRRLKTMLSITYDTPAEKIDVYVAGLLRIITDHPRTRKESYYVGLNNLAPSGMEVLFSVYIDTKEYEEEVVLRQELLMSILRLTEMLQIRFAYPTTTVHLDGPQTKNPPILKADGTPQTLADRLEDFFTEEAKDRAKKEAAEPKKPGESESS